MRRSGKSEISADQPSMVTNVSAYRFARLENLKPLREQLMTLCRESRLKGTILLSTEGVNLFVAGERDAVDQLLAILRSIPGLEGLAPKVSESNEQPFSRMIVKIKKEIIAFGVEGIDPVNAPAPRLTPRELKTWLDEGRPLTLLDTRNDYEVELGTFRNALPIGIRHFREFPAVAAKLECDPKAPIVTFCTGGIRCEKAAPFLQRLGFEKVFQLDGGILKYFEEVGSDHYQGECFVFDKRVGVDAQLGESSHGICFACQSLLTSEEMADPRTVEGVSCPNCFRTTEEQLVHTIAEREQQLRRITCPLPGSVPQDNYRPLKIGAVHEGWTMLDFLATVFPHISRADWEAQCQRGDVVDENKAPVCAEQRIQPGERHFTRERLSVEPDVNANIKIIHEDKAIIVVDKPAPLPMHPSGRFHRNTLQTFLQTVYAPEKPRPTHRLDANITGVALFARTTAYARKIQAQFESGAVEKTYIALVIGHPCDDRFSCEAQIGESDGLLGARVIAENDGLASRTDFEVLSRSADGTALLQVKPRTGRTNQIRVHLWHLGIPIVGDPMYLPDRRLGDTQTLSLQAEPLCLHAEELSFVHPLSGERVTYSAKAPDWKNALTRRVT